MQDAEEIFGGTDELLEEYQAEKRNRLDRQAGMRPLEEEEEDEEADDTFGEDADDPDAPRPARRQQVTSVAFCLLAIACLPCWSAPCVVLHGLQTHPGHTHVGNAGGDGTQCGPTTMPVPMNSG